MCDFLATAVSNFGRRLLKFKRSNPKLGLLYYARVYGRLMGQWGIARREATMSLTFRPKLNKIVELLLYLAHKRPGADKYQAVKFFYLADREHLDWYGRPISFDTYFALQYGPVASNAMDLLEHDPRALRAAGIEDLPFKTEEKNGITYIREPTREVDTELFSRTDLQVFDEILAEYGQMSFDELFNLTHGHVAYTNAWDKRGFSNRSLMEYGDMVEDQKKRAAMEEDLAPVSAKM
jgi:uncharacterized phage-associated protein